MARTNNEMKLLALHGSHECICADFRCLLSVLMIVIVISDYCTSCKEDLQKLRHVREEGRKRSKRSLLQQATRLRWDTAWVGYQILLRVDFKSPLPFLLQTCLCFVCHPAQYPYPSSLAFVLLATNTSNLHTLAEGGRNLGRYIPTKFIYLFIYYNFFGKGTY
jgi:hypothetical protein